MSLVAYGEIIVGVTTLAELRPGVMLVVALEGDRQLLFFLLLYSFGEDLAG